MTRIRATFLGGLMKLLLAVLLIPLLAAFQEPPGTPDFQAEVKALRTEFQKASQEHGKKWQAASAEERKAMKNPAVEYLEKFQDLAERAKGTEGGASALFEIFQLAPRAGKAAEARKAVETLVANHIASPTMEKLASSMRYASYQIGEPAVVAALKAIEEKSPHAKAKAAALFTYSTVIMEKNATEAKAGFERLKKDFADSPYAARADAFLFEAENLQVGQVAPDFEAKDEMGVAWKLSDYRGKVTVIDFWGFW
jgi:hypothetical protein